VGCGSWVVGGEGVQGVFGARHGGGCRGSDECNVTACMVTVSRQSVKSSPAPSGVSFTHAKNPAPRLFWCWEAAPQSICARPHTPERHNLIPDRATFRNSDLIVRVATFGLSDFTKLLCAMWILPFLGYVGLVLGFAFLTLAIGMLRFILSSEMRKLMDGCCCSFGSILPVRTRRRTHCPRQETVNATHLRRRGYTSPTSTRGWIPTCAERVERGVACHICAEPTAVSHRQAH
jgi:hypothetical protein